MTLWGGAFDEPAADVLWRFTVDEADRRLLGDDVEGSIAHAAMLGDVGLLQEAEAREIIEGLGSIKAEAEAGTFVWLATDEDVHSAVERRLGELVGQIAGKLHTGRSRNDQVALDIRSYLRRAAADRIEDVAAFVGVLVTKAEEVGERIVPFYTHLQQAQAVPLAHHLLAHAWPLMRDRERFRDVAARLEESPLGAGAGGGSSLPLDAAGVAHRMRFGAVFANSLDAVASRDLVAEYVFCCSQAMVHLSRLAEEAVLWATTEFGWASFADAYTTGSSALPQKKNPDIAEVVRGRAATTLGDLAAIMALQKGLPLAYNRDLQEDKRLVFHADDTLRGALEAFGAMLSTAQFDPPEPGGWVGALDLAETLVGRGVPFREAHDAVGRVVAALVAQGRTLGEASLDDLAAVDDRFVHGDLEATDPARSVAARATQGGGSFSSVAAQIERLRTMLG